jgi:hypothetical protein
MNGARHEMALVTERPPMYPAASPAISPPRM